MDSHDSSAPPPHRLLHHHHDHHQHQHQHQPPPQLHPAAFLGSHNQPQQYQPNNSYPLPNNNNNSVTTTSTTMNTMNSNMMHQQNPRFPFNAMTTASIAPKPLDHHFSDGSPSGGGSGGLSVEPAKKKRGRPRKYSPDSGIGLGLSSPASSNQASAVRGASGGAGGTPSSETPSKRNRGRPPGSGKKQLDALGIPGVGFTPHVILVAAGEDIASKIMAFSEQGPRTVCILSANGSVSNVTLRQPAMSSGSVTYEGRFEIISLSGSLLSESDNNCNRIGGLNVSLASSDGRVLGGGVAGILKAASLVQVIVGSFIADGKKSKSGHSHMLNFGAQATGISPASPGASSESAEENDDSPLNHGSGPYTNAGQPVQNIPMYSNMGWANMKMLPN